MSKERDLPREKGIERKRKPTRTSFISDEAIKAVIGNIKGCPIEDFDYLSDSYLKSSSINYDFFTHEFQIFRLGSLGWELPIEEEDKKVYGIKINSISTLVEQTMEDNTKLEEIFINELLMRAFVASFFAKQSKIDGTHLPNPSNKIIDAYPVPKDKIDKVSASKKGMYIFDQDELFEKWNLENPELYNETMNFKDYMTKRLTSNLIKAYSNVLPNEYLEKTAPLIQDAFERDLLTNAARMYAWITPTPPPLIEITKIVNRNKDK